MNDEATFWRASATGIERVEGDSVESVDTVSERNAATAFRAWLQARFLWESGRMAEDQAGYLFDRAWQRILILPRHALVLQVDKDLRGYLPGEMSRESIFVIQAEHSPDGPSLIFHRLEDWTRRQRALVGDLR